MTALAQAISGALVQFVWQGFLVAFGLSVAMFLLRGSDPRIRYLISCAALFILAALPVATAIALYDPLASNAPGPAALTLTIRSVWNHSGARGMSNAMDGRSMPHSHGFSGCGSAASSFSRPVSRTSVFASHRSAAPAHSRIL